MPATARCASVAPAARYDSARWGTRNGQRRNPSVWARPATTPKVVATHSSIGASRSPRTRCTSRVSGMKATAVRVSTYQTAISGVPPAANLARMSAVGWRRMSGYSKSCCSRVKQTVNPRGTTTRRMPAARRTARVFTEDFLSYQGRRDAGIEYLRRQSDAAVEVVLVRCELSAIEPEIQPECQCARSVAPRHEHRSSARCWALASAVCTEAHEEVS